MSSKTKEKIIIIVGPTAVGKTALGVELAEKIYGEVISGDSMQVYKNLDIGTAKVTRAEAKDIPHYLIDIIDIHTGYSASDFQKQAQILISEITARQRVPIIVGGTGLYIEGLIYDVSHGGDSPKNHELRQKLNHYAEENGRYALWEKLKEKDPTGAENIHHNNIQRVVRALEVIHETGKPFSEFQTERTKENSRYDTFIIALDTDRKLLYERINQRVDLMMDEGLLEEARWLYEKSYADDQAVKGIGYKEFFPYIRGEETLEQAVENVKQNSRRYAKRQLTWFRNRTPVDLWVDIIQYPVENENVHAAVVEFLET